MDIDFSINTRLRSAAMASAVITVSAAVLLTGVVSASAATIPWRDHRPLSTFPAAAAPASPLSNAITALSPYAYWPLNDGTSAQSDASGHGRASLTTAGTGPTVLHSSSNPPGGSGGSVRFVASARQRGQYLRSVARPVPVGLRGTLVVWFKLNRTLTGWSQTLVADNGAATGWGAGLFVNAAGRLVVSDSSATVYSGGVPDNFCYTGGACPHVVTRPLNDGRWHMAAFVDQYNIDLSDNGRPRPRSEWLPSLLYVDGRLVDSTIEGRLLDAYGWNAKSRLQLGAGQRNQDARLGMFKGDVADVALFDRLLTADDIASVWQAGR